MPIYSFGSKRLQEMTKAYWQLNKFDVETPRRALLASHTTAQDVGKIAAAASVKLLVLSHLVVGEIDVTDDQWIAGRENYSGKVTVAKDLMDQ
jgi:ribonuclease BN (tRNA processing enzyme)